MIDQHSIIVYLYLFSDYQERQSITPVNPQKTGN